MHQIEPYYNWRHIYCAEEDKNSPFHGRVYSEFEFTNRLYNFLLHPQWDDFGSPTLFLKILYTNYAKQFTIIELLGEWNDCISNDIMWLKREIIDHQQNHGICRFILIGENVLNFHGSDDCYYEEWAEDVLEQNGWIALINFNDHVVAELHQANVAPFVMLGEQFDDEAWRTHDPETLFNKLDHKIEGRLLKS